jgi:hypothetical protein
MTGGYHNNQHYQLVVVVNFSYLERKSNDPGSNCRHNGAIQWYIESIESIESYSYEELWENVQCEDRRSPKTPKRLLKQECKLFLLQSNMTLFVQVFNCQMASFMTNWSKHFASVTQISRLIATTQIYVIIKKISVLKNKDSDIGKLIEVIEPNTKLN